MPFTLFHPALVLPLRHLPKRWVSLTGLVAGSVAPDFEKFAKMSALNHYSHTWPSLLYFTLPVGLGLCFVFHGVVRDPLVLHLPAGVRGRLGAWNCFDWSRHFVRHCPAVLASVLLGGASHLLWDNFTHRASPLARQLPFLDARFGVGIGRVPGFLLVGVASSLVAVGYMAYLLRRQPRFPSMPGPVGSQRRYWGTVALLTALVVAARAWAFATTGNHWDIIVTVLSAFLLSLVLAPLLARARAAGSGAPTEKR